MGDGVFANAHFILPVGTQVVTAAEVFGTSGEVVYPAGSVGEVTRAPSDNEHSYRVRFLDGNEVALRRQQLAIRKQVQQAGLQPAWTEETEADLYQYVIYRCVVGSRAYGLDGPGSDTDRRGIYLPPAALQWSLYGVPEQLERDETQE